MTQPTEKLEEDVEKRFNAIWKNLYTYMPGLGQGDAIPAVKQFLAQELSKQRKEDFERVAFWIEQGTFDYVEMKVKQELKSLTKGTK